MKTVSSFTDIRVCTAEWRKAGLKVALVPTMGYFHEGHLALMRYARQCSDRIVVSLFVNPIQFGPTEDLAAYPRDLVRDSAMAESTGADVLFCPSAEDMYDGDFQTTISVEKVSQGLCGASRPGHFTGVATVVTKLFNLIRPHLAVFGEKDFQQLAVIRRLVRDLNIDIEIVGHPIVREADGLAMSSRNTYLNAEERQVATCLFAAIQSAKNKVGQVDRPVTAAEIENETRIFIESHKGCSVDYVTVVNRNSLQNAGLINSESVLTLAVKINNRVRLIDNAELFA